MLKKKQKLQNNKTPFSLKLFLIFPLIGVFIFAFWLNFNQKNSVKIENYREYTELIQNQERDRNISEDYSKRILGIETGQIRVPILLYHYVGENPNPSDTARDYLSVTPQKFDEELQYLSQNGYQTISLDTLAAALENGGTLPPKPIILTFDDGYIDFYLNAFPIISKYNFSGTVFIITGKVGQDMFLNWNQIEEMARSGRVIFNSHGIYHGNLGGLGGGNLDNEVTASKKEIESHTGYPVNFLAYPYGSFSGNVISSLQKAGYVGAVTTRIGSIETKNNLYTLPRIKIAGNISLSEFVSRLNW